MKFLRARKRTKIVMLLVTAGVLLGCSAVILWWQNTYTSPQNVFERMLSNSFATTSVTKQSLVKNEAQTLLQTNNLQIAPEPRIHGLVEITQGGEQKSFVKRESLTTPTTNFIRLVTITTDQKDSSGHPFSFSPILGIWGQGPADESNNSLSQLFGQNVAVPYAHLSATARTQLLAQIQHDGVYGVNYGAIQTKIHNGRKAYVYNVNVKPEAFIKMMKTIGKQAGVKGYEDVDPASYKSLPPVKFVFTVDVVSGDLVNVDYGNGQVENYSGVGNRTTLQNPNKAVTMLELQQRLQSLQR